MNEWHEDIEKLRCRSTHSLTKVTGQLNVSPLCSWYPLDKRLVRAQSHQIHHGEQNFFSFYQESKLEFWITRVVAMSLY